MHKALLYCLLLTFLFFKSYAQVTPSDKQIMDSLIKNDEFMKMLDKMDDVKSYVRINIGIGNRLFSGNNKAVQNESTLNPPTILVHNKIIIALMTSKNNPKVRIVTGKVSIINIGLINMLSKPKTTATIRAVVKPAT